MNHFADASAKPGIALGAPLPNMDQNPQDPHWIESESVFVEWMLEGIDGNRIPFDRLCAQHPRLALHLKARLEEDQALRRLAKVMGASSGGLEHASSSFDERTEVEYGVGDSPSEARTQQLLDRVRGRNLAFGKYHINRKVGSGTMGVVYRVWDGDLQRFVALKVMSSRSGAQEPPSRRSLIRFVEEAQVTAQLDHPNVVPVHDFGVTANGQAYFTMKFVKGGREFSNIIAMVHDRTSSWTLTRALGVLLKVCEGVSYAHVKGVVHRDLKPSNIMVGRFGEAYVMDWGLAHVDELHGHTTQLTTGEMTVKVNVRAGDRASDADPYRTQDGVPVGTPLYMSPEQARGDRREVGIRSDVYGLGAILYHLLAGVAPYADPYDTRLSADEVLRQIKAGPPRPIASAAPGSPYALQRIVERAMQRNAADRHESVAEFSNDIIAFIEGRVVGHGTWRPLNALVGAGRWVRRNRVSSILVGTLIFVLLWLPRGWTRGAGSEQELEPLHGAARAALEASAESGLPFDAAMGKRLLEALAERGGDIESLATRVSAIADEHRSR